MSNQPEKKVAAPVDPARVAAALLARHAGGELELVSCRKIQTLWAGYGFICEVKARRRRRRADITSTATSESSGDGYDAVPTRGADTRKDEDEVSLILKLISPPPSTTARKKDEGHLRKMLSYEVERYFYSAVATGLPRGEVAVAECIGTTWTPITKATRAGQEQGRDYEMQNSHDQSFRNASSLGDSVLDGVLAILMTDLRVEFPVAGEKRSELTERQVHAAIDWLAKFHASTWAHGTQSSMEDLVQPPLREAERRKLRAKQEEEEQNGVGELQSVGTRVWLNGGYTYLATRRTEFLSLMYQLEEDDDHDEHVGEWSAALCRPLTTKAAAGAEEAPLEPCVAEVVAEVLTPRGDRDYETLIHGDVKSENLFTTAEHDRVAFFDFQYVGVGLGACDLAKLFTCSVPMRTLLGGDGAKGARARIAHGLGIQAGEEALLRKYHDTLLNPGPAGNKEASSVSEKGREYPWELFMRHWETALVDWHRFQMSWGQWGNTDWLEARVRAILKDEGWRRWLQESYDDCVARKTQ